MNSLFLLSTVSALSWLIVYGIRRWAEQRQVLDIPNQRSSHSRPTARGGGLAIVVTTLGAWLIYGWIRPEESRGMILPYACGATLIAVVSWLDDLHTLSSRRRFLIHSLGALLVIGGYGYWQTPVVPVFGPIHLGWIGLPLTFLWIVGLTNAYNFMDGIDGIAGGQALVAGLGWTLLGWLLGEPLVQILGLLIAAGTLGFLAHNWPPARIFMGDVGSAFLGYTFAVIPLLANHGEDRLLVANVLLLWPFLFDSIFTFVRRLCRGENVFTAHRSHLYQRLILAGHSHRFVTLLYSGLALSGATLSLLWVQRVSGSQAAIIMLLPVLCLALWLYVICEEHRLMVLTSCRPESQQDQTRVNH